MFKYSAEKLTNILIENKVISEEDSDLYSYGFEIGFSIVANILTTILIGLAFKMPLESIAFLMAFIPLRSYIGGFHASNHIRCYWLSVFAVIAVLFAARFVLNIYNLPVIIGIGSICAIIMFILVPVKETNRPLDEVEIRIFRHRARIIICLELFVMLALSFIGLKTIVSILFCTFCLTCISTCAGVIRNLYFKYSNTDYS